MRWIILVAALGIAGCDTKTAEEQAADDARDVAIVRANQEPPPEELEPQAILYPDIEEHDLFGAGCSFVPEGGGLGAIAIAMENEGYMKRGEAILKFAADLGSAELPYLARRKYDGLDYSFTLDLEDNDGEKSGMETVDYPARLAVKDGQDRVIYESDGMAQCGA